MVLFKRLLVVAPLLLALLVVAACMPVVNLPGKQSVRSSVGNGYFIASDGAKLPLRAWLPSDARVTAALVAVHGFNDYSNFFAAPGNYLSRLGIASYAYDQRGFGGAPDRGLWAGTAAYADDLSRFIREVRTRHPGVPLYVLGESMGGAVTIVAMTAGNRPDVDGVILVAPAVWARETMPWYQRWLLAVSAYTVPWLELTGKGLHIFPSDNIDMLRSLGRDPLVIRETRVDAVYGLTNLMDEALVRAEKLQLPALVLYGKNDQVIPKQPIFLMLQKMPGTPRKAFYEHGYHLLLRDLQGEKPLADIAAWIADHHTPLTYGADNWTFD